MAEWAATFKAIFTESGSSFCASFSEEGDHFCADFGEVIEVDHGYDPYPGPYIVIPKAWQDQTLPTNGKNMEDDVLVLEVPYVEVSNVYGTTVSIATE